MLLTLLLVMLIMVVMMLLLLLLLLLLMLLLLLLMMMSITVFVNTRCKFLVFPNYNRCLILVWVPGWVLVWALELFLLWFRSNTAARNLELCKIRAYGIYLLAKHCPCIIIERRAMNSKRIKNYQLFKFSLSFLTQNAQLHSLSLSSWTLCN